MLVPISRDQRRRFGQRRDGVLVADDQLVGAQESGVQRVDASPIVTVWGVVYKAAPAKDSSKDTVTA